MLLYKYRGLSNLQFVLDIIINGRMFAAPFEQLNDPMEGSYNYGPDKLTKDQIRTLYGQKAEYRLVSLTRKSNSTLMWSHYAEAHTGIVIGVLVNHRAVHRVDVDYVDDLTLNLAYAEQNTQPIARTILSRKLLPWKYEDEHRIFVRKRKNNPTFVNVQIKEIIFGIYTDKDKRQLITKLAEAFCPGIQLRNMTQSKLDIKTKFD